MLYHHPRDWSEVGQTIVPQVVLLAFLEESNDICFPPVFGHLSHLPQLRRPHSFTMTSATSFSTHGCNPSGPMELRSASSSILWPPTKGHLPCPSLLVCFSGLEVPKVLLVKSEGRKAFSALISLLSIVKRYSDCMPMRTHSFICWKLIEGGMQIKCLNNRYIRRDEATKTVEVVVTSTTREPLLAW